MSDWSEADIELLKRMFEEGTSSTSEMVATLGGRYTRNAVIGKLHRMGLKRERQIRPRKVEQPKLWKPKLVPVPEPVIENQIGTVEFFDLERRHCRWPMEGKTYCGAQRVKGHPYCAAHRAKAYQPRK